MSSVNPNEFNKRGDDLESYMGSLNAWMSREFDYDTVLHLCYELMPQAVQAGDVHKARLIEEVLTKYGYAYPNHLTGMWSGHDVPRNEVQVREMFSHRLPEFGYHIVRSGEVYPDWLLVNDEGEFVYAEVEHRSSHFAVHNHDPGLCDLVVCWEHDEPEIPVRVFELFSGEHFEPQHPAEPKYKNTLRIHWSGVKTKPQYFADGSGQTFDLIASQPFDDTQAKAYELVNALREQGYKEKPAVSKVAEQMDLESTTVRSYVSRHRKKLRYAAENR